VNGSDPRDRHPIDIVPPSTHASPSDMSHPSFEDDVPFWKPDWRDVMKQMGWRWVLLLPAAGFIAVFAAIPAYPRLLTLLAMGGGKLLLLSIGGAVGVAGKAIRSAVGLRKEPFCIHCGYNLTGLEEGHLCPECGRPFSLKLIEEYRRDPHWFIKRYKGRKAVPLADILFDAGTVRRPKSRDGT
jgi:hypothetical protein